MTVKKIKQELELLKLLEELFGEELIKNLKTLNAIQLRENYLEEVKIYEQLECQLVEVGGNYILQKMIEMEQRKVELKYLEICMEKEISFNSEIKYKK